MEPRASSFPRARGRSAQRPMNTSEPRPLPTCPSHLCSTAKAEWKRLTRDLHKLERAVLAAYCQACGRWVQAERKLKETALVLKLPSGYIQQNPWLTIANKQLELMHKYLSELGLSPVTRTRVQARPLEDEDYFARASFT
jgi:P27 family predicted phage terminase small subunit